jgi:hypothetical protein
LAELGHPPDSILGFGVPALRQRAVFLLCGGGVVLPDRRLVAFLEPGDRGVAAQDCGDREQDAQSSQRPIVRMREEALEAGHRAVV